MNILHKNVSYSKPGNKMKSKIYLKGNTFLVFTSVS